MEENWTRLGDETNRVVAKAARERAAAHLHQLGPRPLLEAMTEVASGQPLDAVLARYGQINPDIVTALGGGGFVPFPLHEVTP